MRLNHIETELERINRKKTVNLASSFLDFFIKCGVLLVLTVGMINVIIWLIGAEYFLYLFQATLALLILWFLWKKLWLPAWKFIREEDEAQRN